MATSYGYGAGQTGTATLLHGLPGGVLKPSGFLNPPAAATRAPVAPRTPAPTGGTGYTTPRYSGPSAAQLAAQAQAAAEAKARADIEGAYNPFFASLDKIRADFDPQEASEQARVGTKYSESLEM